MSRDRPWDGTRPASRAGATHRPTTPKVVHWAECGSTGSPRGSPAATSWTAGTGVAGPVPAPPGRASWAVPPRTPGAARQGVARLLAARVAVGGRTRETTPTSAEPEASASEAAAAPSPRSRPAALAHALPHGPELPQPGLAGPRLARPRLAGPGLARPRLAGPRPARLLGRPASGPLPTWRRTRDRTSSGAAAAGNLSEPTRSPPSPAASRPTPRPARQPPRRPQPRTRPHRSAPPQAPLSTLPQARVWPPRQVRI